MLVPILAPMTIGTAVLTLRPPAATSETMTDVHVEELCTQTVKRMPIIKPTIGLDIIDPPKIFPENQGDCDNDEECVGDLVCGRNSCPSYFPGFVII